MEQTRLIALLEKHIAGALPDPEWQELLRTAGGPEGEATIRQALETLMERTPAGQPYDAARFDPILRQALASDMPIPIPAPRRIPLFRRIAAAAAILLLLAGAGIYLLARHPQPPALATLQQDIPPGHAGAILHLSNGKTIILDSAADGTVARQGGVEAVKTNGQLNYTGKTSDPVYNTISTDRGRQWQLTLPDGTKVWLNALSTLRFPTAFSGHERSVQLTGEAYFEIAKNMDMPFFVKTGETSVEVLGTRFNISAYKDDPIIRTTLLEGKIRINQSDNKKEVTLHPGQQAFTQNSDIHVIDNVNTEEVVAWKNGLFEFSNASIESIMLQIQRWYGVEVSYETTDIKRLSGTVPRNLPISVILKILESTGQVHFNINNNKITVKK